MPPRAFSQLRFMLHYTTVGVRQNQRLAFVASGPQALLIGDHDHLRDLAQGRDQISERTANAWQHVIRK
jgi:hypothetical protein